MKYLDRQRATDRLRDLGVKLTNGTLRDAACRGNGPRYTLINGRALYTEADLMAWLERGKPPRAAASAAAAAATSAGGGT